MRTRFRGKWLICLTVFGDDCEFSSRRVCYCFLLAAGKSGTHCTYCTVKASPFAWSSWFHGEMEHFERWNNFYNKPSTLVPMPFTGAVKFDWCWQRRGWDGPQFNLYTGKQYHGLRQYWSHFNYCDQPLDQNLIAQARYYCEDAYSSIGLVASFGKVYPLFVVSFNYTEIPGSSSTGYAVFEWQEIESQGI